MKLGVLSVDIQVGVLDARNVTGGNEAEFILPGAGGNLPFPLLEKTDEQRVGAVGEFEVFLKPGLHHVVPAQYRDLGRQYAFDGLPDAIVQKFRLRCGIEPAVEPDSVVVNAHVLVLVG